MIKFFENEVFENYYDSNSGREFCDLEFRSCSFRGCDLSITSDPQLRSTVRRVKLYDCTYLRNPAGLASPVVEDCLVENLRIEGLLQTWGAVFKRVVLRGKIDRLMISTDVPVGMSRTESQVAALSEANTAYYATVDWALDISQAEFKECSLRVCSCTPSPEGSRNSSGGHTGEGALRRASQDTVSRRCCWPLDGDSPASQSWRPGCGVGGG
jgi:hypothetical protein